MKLLVFDIRGSIAHFKRPDTTATHASYPFITRTALRGLLGAILGLDEFHGEAWTGIQLLSPVRTRTQELSLLGKGFLSDQSRQAFNRPTAIELVIEPHYRIYYAGEHFETLSKRIQSHQSHYHTYLGSAFALTVPEFGGIIERELIEPKEKELLGCITVVPSHAIAHLTLVEDAQYARCGGVLYEYLGNRRFRGTVNLIYEINGNPIVFQCYDDDLIPPVFFVRLSSEEVAALW